jgi:class 3 adenylate cyclase
MGIRDKPIAPGSPWQNGCRRTPDWNASARMPGSCFDFGERHLWRLLASYSSYCSRTLGSGTVTAREIDTAGDGFFAAFDGPARAIRCGCAITREVSSLGIEIRAGLHTGECELVDGKIGGIAVHIGARVASQATPGEVLVSQTVRDLVAGSGLEFEERGETELKGVPGEWRLYAVAP